MLAGLIEAELAAAHSTEKESELMDCLCRLADVQVRRNYTTTHSKAAPVDTQSFTTLTPNRALHNAACRFMPTCPFMHNMPVHAIC